MDINGPFISMDFAKMLHSKKGHKITIKIVTCGFMNRPIYGPYNMDLKMSYLGQTDG